MEVYGPKQRTFVGMVYQMGYAIGYMVFGGLSYHWRDWHDLCVSIIPIPCPITLVSEENFYCDYRRSYLG